jgi:hypothetical protein
MTADSRRSAALAIAIGLALFAPWFFGSSHAQQASRAAAPSIDADDIGGVVTGPSGPEAGVWVITDDQGRYVIPDLPRARYAVWARGYGLVDSAKSTSEPGKIVNFSATPAPTPADAAKYYPAIYWYSMLKVPSAADMGNRELFAGNMTQQRWLGAVKNLGCVGCHQLGQLSTRTIPASLGPFASGADAWKRRVRSGQAGEMMFGQLNGLGPGSFKLYGDWTDRVAKGELPHTRPSRPQGAERNIVVTLRDWMNEKQYLHDLISSDRRHPTVNGNGPVFGSPEYSSDLMPILDPVENKATTFRMPVRDPQMPFSLGPGHAAALKPLAPSPYWGDEAIWDTRCSTPTGACGWPRRCAVRTTRRSAAKGLRIHRQSSSRSIATSGRSRSSSRRRRSTRSWIRASARITSSSATTRTIRSGRAAAGPCSAG